MGTLLEACYSRGLQRFQASKPDKKLKRSGLYALVPLRAALNHLPLTPHRKLPKSLAQIDMATPPPATPPTPDWAGLPDDALLTVFKRLGASEVLLGTAVVCRNWLRVATGEPDLWRRVDLSDCFDPTIDMVAMACAAVDRAGGRPRRRPPRAFRRRLFRQ